LTSRLIAAAAVLTIFQFVSLLPCAAAAPDPSQALQTLLTDDQPANDLMIAEYQRGYDDGYAGRTRDNAASKAKAPDKKVGRGMEEAYKKGFSLGRQDKTAEDAKRAATAPK
jgi:hypothetical protein